VIAVINSGDFNYFMIMAATELGMWGLLIVQGFGLKRRSAW